MDRQPGQTKIRNGHQAVTQTATDHRLHADEDIGRGVGLGSRSLNYFKRKSFFNPLL